MKKTVKIKYGMFKDLCHDAKWRIEEFEDDGPRVRVYHRLWGGDLIIYTDDDSPSDLYAFEED